MEGLLDLLLLVLLQKRRQLQQIPFRQNGSDVVVVGGAEDYSAVGVAH